MSPPPTLLGERPRTGGGAGAAFGIRPAGFASGGALRVLTTRSLVFFRVAGASVGPTFGLLDVTDELELLL